MDYKSASESWALSKDHCEVGEVPFQSQGRHLFAVLGAHQCHATAIDPAQSLEFVQKLT